MSQPIADLPAALDAVDRLGAQLGRRSLAVFLDFDGTLAPIVADPAAAGMPERTRAALLELARRCPVALISGRDLDDVTAAAGVEGVAYAGSHGLDIEGPHGRETYGEEHVEDLDAAEAELSRALEDVTGARIERKRFAIAVHHRQVPAEREHEVEQAVESVAAGHPRLRRTGGKRVLELRPDVDWDKGRAVLWLLRSLDLDTPDVLPVYVGDDLTDEDAFEAVAERGFCVVVRGENDERHTAAHASLPDSAAVGEFLARLAALLDDAD